PYDSRTNMKLSSKLAKLKIQKTKATPVVPPRSRKSKGGMRNWIALFLCLIFAVGGLWGALEIFVWHKLPAALVGTWEVQTGPMQGGTFEFLANGNLTIRSNQGPDMNARAAVDGKSLLTTTTNPVTLRDETRNSTIRELTPVSLVLELEKG